MVNLSLSQNGSLGSMAVCTGNIPGSRPNSIPKKMYPRLIHLVEYVDECNSTSEDEYMYSMYSYYSALVDFRPRPPHVRQKSLRVPARARTGNKLSVDTSFQFTFCMCCVASRVNFLTLYYLVGFLTLSLSSK
jgi:hypothetical protein